MLPVPGRRHPQEAHEAVAEMALVVEPEIRGGGGYLPALPEVSLGLLDPELDVHLMWREADEALEAPDQRESPHPGAGRQAVEVEAIPDPTAHEIDHACELRRKPRAQRSGRPIDPWLGRLPERAQEGEHGGAIQGPVGPDVRQVLRDLASAGFVGHQDVWSIEECSPPVAIQRTHSERIEQDNEDLVLERRVLQPLCHGPRRQDVGSDAGRRANPPAARDRSRPASSDHDHRLGQEPSPESARASAVPRGGLRRDYETEQVAHVAAQAHDEEPRLSQMLPP
jgi:hypothetical protein